MFRTRKKSRVSLIPTRRKNDDITSMNGEDKNVAGFFIKPGKREYELDAIRQTSFPKRSKCLVARHSRRGGIACPCRPISQRRCSLQVLFSWCASTSSLFSLSRHEANTRQRAQLCAVQYALAYVNELKTLWIRFFVNYKKFNPNVFVNLQKAILSKRAGHCSL